MVGGYVRDTILGIKSKDIDFAVEASSYEEMRDDLLSRGTIIFQERPQFFSIRGRHPELGAVDYTLCRKEGFYSDNRHPDSVEVGTIYDDLARRDFTINAIAFEEGPSTSSMDGDRFIDPHEGMIDLKHNILHCVGDPVARFSEDALRLLRAVRFHIVRGFIIDSKIEACLNDRSVLFGLKSISVERIYEELRKCFVADSYRTLDFMRNHRELETIIFKDMKLGLTPTI